MIVCRLDDFRATTSLRDAVYWDSVVDGETAKEAASRLGVSVTTVRSRRKRLRKRFAAYLNERRDERTPSRF
ncbi:MAG: helix-turn-helix domain-containing protein [Thermoguttaceae bacterium]|nr:helix-turn-helix domain-containing protein [Thermoguttaceae bacterium]MBQ6829358.1 helix-turn-helix domain-containing protein [Thermoguttaceae bacterium]MBQ7110518.1 helix-turn-helix domain-containing protein [Thermoguttaceae bacterium]